MLRRTIMAAAVAMTLSFIAIGTSSSPAEAKTCKAYRVAATGDLRPTQFGARRSARRAWSARVKRLVSTKFDTWLFSRGKRYFCKMERGEHRCRAVSTPCRGAI